MSNGYGSRQYWRLGKVVMKKHPEMAYALLSTNAINYKPLETDHNKIENFFTVFCKTSGIQKEEYQGPLHKTSKVDMRRLFVASMVHLYCPHVYEQSPGLIDGYKNGLGLSLAKVLKMAPSNTSNMIREVITWEREYEDFKCRVAGVVEKLKEVRNGCT